MNYDAFERDVIGYGARISRRAECRRRLHGTPAGPDLEQRARRATLRSQLALALRSLADHLDTRSAHAA